jgi:DNA-binding NarL/FixJ family response regulator
MLPGVTPPRPRARWLVCEDGTEYLDRFRRFLGAEFDFARVADAGALVAAATAAGDTLAGVVMDLDFRRTPDELLYDEHGPVPGPLSPAERTRLTESQGIFALRALRRAGSRLPAILCADLDDPEQVAFLEATLGPLAVAPSSESITALAVRLRR